MTVLPDEPQPNTEKPNDDELVQKTRFGSQFRDFFDEPVEVEVEEFDSALMKAINGMHTEQGLALDAFGEHLSDLPEGSSDNVMLHLERFNDTHEDLIRELFKVRSGPELDIAAHQYAAVITNLIAVLRRDVAHYLSDDTDQEEFFGPSQTVQTMEEVVKSSFETEDDFEKMITFLKSEVMEIHTTIFHAIMEYYLDSDLVHEADDEVEKGHTTKSVLRTLGRSAINALSIALGVAGGIVAAYKFINRK